MKALCLLFSNTGPRSSKEKNLYKLKRVPSVPGGQNLATVVSAMEITKLKENICSRSDTFHLHPKNVTFPYEFMRDEERNI